MNADNNDLIPMGAPASEFTIVMRGYERNQVNDAISRLEDDLRTIMSERDLAVQQANDAHARAEQVSVELDELKNEVRHAQAPTFETMGGRIASMLRLAEEEASDIRAEAERDAEQTRAAAQQERELTDQQIASDRAEADQYVADRRNEADDVLARAKSDAAEHLDKHRKLAEETLSTAQAEAARLTAESESHRTEAEEDFKITLAARRKAAEREEIERDRQSRADAAARIQASRDEAAARIQASRDEADAMLTQAHADATAAVDEANTRARTIIADAEDEVNRLQKLRSALAQQIMQIGQLVSNVPAYLAKAPEDLPLDRDVQAPTATAPTAPALYSGDRTDDLAVDTESPAAAAPEEPDGMPAAAATDEAADQQLIADQRSETETSPVQPTDGTVSPAIDEAAATVSDATDSSDPDDADAVDSEGSADVAAQDPADQGGDSGGTPEAPSDGRIVLTRRRGTVATEQRPVQVSAIRQRRTKR